MSHDENGSDALTDAAIACAEDREFDPLYNLLADVLTVEGVFDLALQLYPYDVPSVPEPNEVYPEYVLLRVQLINAQLFLIRQSVRDGALLGPADQRENEDFLQAEDDDGDERLLSDPPTDTRH